MPTAPDSEWYSTPDDKRRAKGLEVMLTDAEREKLEEIAAAHRTSLSRVVAAAMYALAGLPADVVRRLLSEARARVPMGRPAAKRSAGAKVRRGK